MIYEKVLQSGNPAAIVALAKGDVENALIAATPGGIEVQEARGQQDFVANSTLPKDCNFCTREQLEQMGIVFGENVDDLFIEVNLPEGWKKVPTEHSMWTDLVDEKGRKRAAIFYKAAFYDMSSHISLCRRFSYSVRPVGGWEAEKDRKTHPQECLITDCEEVVWRSSPRSPNENLKWTEVDRQLSLLGREWLDEYYSDWENPLAYWEEEK